MALALGGSTPSKIMVGSTQATAVYLGGTLIYSAAPTQTTLASDTFSNWSKWKVINGSASNLTVANNTGTMKPAGANYQTTRAIFNNLAPTGDMLVSADLIFGTGEQYIDFGIHAQDVSGQANPRGYYLSFYPAGDPDYQLLSSDGQYTANDQHFPFTYTAGATWKVKLRIRGNRVQAKVWNATGSEPFGYPLTMVDDPYSTGYVSLGITSGYSNVGQVQIKNLLIQTVVDEPGDTTPSSDSMPTASTVVSSNHTWTKTFSTDFPTDVAEGGFRTAYPSMGAYTEEDGDTATATTGGKYSANKTASVVNGVLTINQRKISGTAYGAAILPDNYTAHTYGRVQFRSRQTDVGGVGGFKFVPLWWPVSGVWNEGEIDWPEADNGQVPRPASAMPGTYNSTTGNMTFLPTNVEAMHADYPTSGWHVYTVDWAPDGISFYQDGKIVGRIADSRGIPTTPMRFVLQAETWIQQGAVPTGAVGKVEVDWFAIYDLA